MKSTGVKILTMTARIGGLAALGIGLVRWIGDDVSAAAHIFFGAVLVAAVWGLAYQSRDRARTLALAAMIWGVALPALGFLLSSSAQGAAHVALQVVHAALGIGGIGLAEVFAKRLLRVSRP